VISLRALANPFMFNNFQVRTAVDNDDIVWFCGLDLCAALDIDNTHNDNTPTEWSRMSLPCSSDELSLKFFNEAGAYRLIFSSNRPNAISLADWVCREVVPVFRNNGFFGKISAKDRVIYLEIVADLTNKLNTTNNAMLHKMLQAELRDCCNVIGRKMPDLTLLGNEYP